MQRIKNTKKIGQIEKVSKSEDAIIENISTVINKFDLKPILKKFDVVKRCGVLTSSITLVLLILPFWGVSTIASLFRAGLNKSNLGKKDVYYGIKNNEKINWRFLLFSIAKRFKYLIAKSTDDLLEIKDNAQSYKALILDDSVLPKRGKSIEGIGYVHDHVTDAHILGYKLLVCGFWDGMSFIPIDFSLHKEKRNRKLKLAEKKLEKQLEKISRKLHQIKEVKQIRSGKKALLAEAKKSYKAKPNKTNKSNLEQKQRILARKNKQIEVLSGELRALKKQAQMLGHNYEELKSTYRYCGLKEKDYRNQFKKNRDRSTSGHKRVKETEVNKIDNSISMIKRAVKHGFIPDYVLTDSWFFCEKFLKAIVKIGRSIKLLSMAKIGTTKYHILLNSELLNSHQIIAKYERSKGKTSRKFKARYIQLQAEYKDVRVQLFLIKFGRHGRWRMLVTTNLKDNFTTIMNIYKIRWTIEVFFKECKQHLLLGKCQSQDFDAQIAETTLSMMRYVLLSYYERIHYGMTIGGLFSKLSHSAMKENLLADISVYFFELIQIFADLAGIDFIPFYLELLRNPKAEKILEHVGINGHKTAA